MNQNGKLYNKNVPEISTFNSLEMFWIYSPSRDLHDHASQIAIQPEKCALQIFNTYSSQGAGGEWRLGGRSSGVFRVVAGAV